MVEGEIPFFDFFHTSNKKYFKILCHFREKSYLCTR